MQTIHANSGHQPLEIDESSSPTTVYVRDNIIETTIQGEDGEVTPWWTYDERQYSREEWEKLQMAKRIIDLECALIDAESEI